MEDRRPQSLGIIRPLIFFAASAAIAALMLITALIAWLSQVLGTIVGATLMVGGFFLIVAWLIYLLAVRRSIDYIRDRLDTVYEVAYSLRNYYTVASKFLRSFWDEIKRR